jgi:ATP-dependent protease HslVU (ClpYQ) peptidase subunit
MTCIVGLIDKETQTIYMGGDSAGVGGRYDIRARKDPKVFIRGPFIIGFTTSFRMGQLLMSDERFTVRPHKAYESNFDYMVSAVVPSIQSLFEKGGFLEEENKVKSGGTFLIGYKGSLFCIESDFQVAEHIDNFNACGCGEDYALGSLHNTTNMSSAERVYQALETAEYFSAGVRKPFNILKLENIKKHEKNT